MYSFQRLSAVAAALLLAGLTADAQEDALRGVCDQAAAQLAAGKPKEAFVLLEPALKAPANAKSPSLDRAAYYTGCAAFLLENDVAAGRALSRLVPFDRAYGSHARYLLGRLHHRAGEWTEAEGHYDAVPPTYEKELAAARQALGNPANLKDPVEKTRLETLVKAPPDYVAESIFHAGVLLYEQKSFTDALARFTAFLQKDKRPLWMDEARLRQGMCQFRLNQPAEAIKALQPLQDHPKLARSARWWIARSILTLPEPKPGDAAEHLKKAAAAPESESGPTTVEIQLALGDALERAGRGAEAVEVYKQAAAGPRAEEALARRIGAHVAAKQFREADAAAGEFEKAYPSSPFLGDVQMRRADVAFAEAQANAGKKEAEPLFAEAIKRYEKVLAGASGATLQTARYRTALSLARLGKDAEALEQLRGIAEQDRSGELIGACLLQAQCLLKLTPAAETALDAVSAEAALLNFQEATAMLQKYLPSAGAQAPELSLKLAQSLRQTAALLAEPGERVQAANQAREIYEAFRAAQPNHPLRPVAEYERANCYALAGDVNSAIQKLERFRADPLGAAPVAPLALLRQAQLYRSINQAPQAAAILAECRAKHEPALLKDPARASWVPLLRYHHAAALKDAKQPAEAVKILESLVKEFGAGEWAEPSRRLLKEVKP